MNNFKKNIFKTDTESVTPPLPIYIAINLSPTSDEQTGSSACSIQSGGGTTKYHSGELPDPIVGDTIFNDINGLTNFKGGAKFWKMNSAVSGSKAMKISNTGLVMDIPYVCP